MQSCPGPKASLPIVITTNVTNLTQTTAVSGGNVTNDGGSDVTARGVCWGTTKNPTVSVSKSSNGTGIGAFTSNITGLSANTNYHVRAYATNEAGTSYGNDVTFNTSLLIGDSYQGGIVFYILQAGDPGYITGQIHGLIAAPSDQSTNILWSNGSFITTVATTSTDKGTGMANTKAIIASQGTGSYAASLCKNLILSGYSDWYLPSKDELNQVYINKTILGVFAVSNYWSSSESSNAIAWGQSFYDGGQYPEYKYSSGNVRAIRSF